MHFIVTSNFTILDGPILVLFFFFSLFHFDYLRAIRIDPVFDILSNIHLSSRGESLATFNFLGW